MTTKVAVVLRGTVFWEWSHLFVFSYKIRNVPFTIQFYTSGIWYCCCYISCAHKINATCYMDILISLFISLYLSKSYYLSVRGTHVQFKDITHVFTITLKKTPNLNTLLHIFYYSIGRTSSLHCINQLHRLR